MSAGSGFGEAAETAFAAAKIFYRSGEVGGIEFRPHARREQQLRVGAFPEHEVAEAAVATGADQQVHVQSGTAGVGDFTEAFRKFALRNFQAGKHPAGGAEDGVARGVIYGDAQFEGAAGGSKLFGSFDGLRERRGDAVATADHAQADSRGCAGRGFGAKILFEQREQGNDLAHGAVPVVRGKRVERKGANAQAGSGAHDAANGFHAGAMSFGASEAARGGPAAIAIEENGDVELRLGD